MKNHNQSNLTGLNTRSLRLAPLLLFFLFCGKNNAQGIKFKDLAWEASLEAARTNQQLVFVDAYTQWCAPCKMLAVYTFPDSALGTFFNSHFVNVKVDLEHGEGPALNALWMVNAYPTLLFFDSTGEEVHRAVGFFSAKQLLEIGQQAAQPDQQIRSLKQAYLRGDRQAKQLKLLLSSLELAADPSAGNVARAYLQLFKNYGEPALQNLILKYADNPEQAPFQYLLRHRGAFSRRFGKEKVEARIQLVVEQYLQMNQTLSDKKVQAIRMKAFPKNKNPQKKP